MQEKSEFSLIFSERTDALASHFGIRVIDLPKKIKISEDMLMGYRTGRYPISKKAWMKLDQAEIEAGLRKDREELNRAFKKSIDALPPESRKAVTAPHVAWGHYQAMTSLLDDALKTRRPLPDAQAEDDFQCLLQIFSRGRKRGREAMRRTCDLAESIAKFLMQGTEKQSPER